MTALATLLTLVGTAVLVVAAWGVVTLPDALSRQHAATKAGTLALALIAFGAFAAQPDAAFGVRLALILVFLVVTLPVASHLLARAAVREQAIPTDGVPKVGGESDPPLA